MSSISLALGDIWLASTLPLSTSASSTVAGCKLPSTLPLARRMLQNARYALPFTSNSTSALDSAVPRVMISLDVGVIGPNRGVWWYKAKQMASNNVVLPAPVGPTMANNPFSENGG